MQCVLNKMAELPLMVPWLFCLGQRRSLWIIHQRNFRILL